MIRLEKGYLHKPTWIFQEWVGPTTHGIEGPSTQRKIEFCQAQSKSQSQPSWTDLALLSLYIFWLFILPIMDKYENGIKLELADLNRSQE